MTMLNQILSGQADLLESNFTVADVAVGSLGASSLGWKTPTRRPNH